MEFPLSTEHQMAQKMVRDFAQKEIHCIYFVPNSRKLINIEPL